MVWEEIGGTVPNQEKLKKHILNEAHESFFSIDPRSNKMYQDVRKRFRWKGLKQDIACFVVECDTCCGVKAEHLKQAGTLHPLPIPAWKWKIYLWISLPACHGHRVYTTLFGL